MKRKATMLLYLILAYWSLEILWRRWAWGQIPTQVAPLFLYSLLFLNAVLLCRFFQKARG